MAEAVVSNNTLCVLVNAFNAMCENRIGDLQKWLLSHDMNEQEFDNHLREVGRALGVGCPPKFHQGPIAELDDIRAELARIGLDASCESSETVPGWVKICWNISEVTGAPELILPALRRTEPTGNRGEMWKVLLECTFMWAMNFSTEISQRLVTHFANTSSE